MRRRDPIRGAAARAHPTDVNLNTIVRFAAERVRGTSLPPTRSYQEPAGGTADLQQDRLLVPLSNTSAELLFELISQRYKRGSTLITINLPSDE